jgi:hypothetical protein
MEGENQLCQNQIKHLSVGRRKSHRKKKEKANLSKEEFKVQGLGFVSHKQARMYMCLQSEARFAHPISESYCK